MKLLNLRRKKKENKQKSFFFFFIYEICWHCSLRLIGCWILLFLVPLSNDIFIMCCPWVPKNLFNIVHLDLSNRFLAVFLILLPSPSFYYGTIVDFLDFFLNILFISSLLIHNMIFAMIKRADKLHTMSCVHWSRLNKFACMLCLLIRYCNVDFVFGSIIYKLFSLLLFEYSTH